MKRKAAPTATRAESGLTAIESAFAVTGGDVVDVLSQPKSSRSTALVAPDPAKITHTSSSPPTAS